MCLEGSNILEPQVFLDRIAIPEIIIKCIYFYFPNSKSFIYENLIFRGALFIDFGTEVLSQAYIIDGSAKELKTQLKLRGSDIASAHS